MDASAGSLVVNGVWFDGQRAVRQDARVRIVNDSVGVSSGDARLQVVVDGHERAFPVAGLRMAERWRQGPWPLALPDGSTLWLDESAAPLLNRLPTDYRRLRTWRDTIWRLALVTMALMALLFWLDRQGAGWLAQGVVQMLPRAVDEHVGAQVMAQIDTKKLKVSSVSEERQAALRERFDAAVARVAPDVKVRLLFRSYRTADTDSDAETDTDTGPDLRNFNAFAAPDGTICLLDGLTSALSDDEVMAVLGHELGHVVHRHSMQAIARAIGFVTLAGLVWGDGSAAVRTVSSGLQVLRHSRDAEREADAYARGFIAYLQLPPQTLLSTWMKFSQALPKSAGAPPAWLTTHPGLDERIDTERRLLPTSPQADRSPQETRP